MRIVTWNVNSIRTRLHIIPEWIQETAPDVILLQELKCVDEAFPHEFIEDLGYNIALHGQKTFNGVGILSKFPIEDVTKNLPNFEDPQARYIEAFTGGVRVASLYAPNGSEVGSDKFNYKLSFYKHLRAHLQNVLKLDEMFLIGGDFNIAPKDQDVHDPERWKGSVLVSPEERAEFQGLLNLGLNDTLRLLHPEEEAEQDAWYTWWDYRKGAWHRNWGLRIDHILTSHQTKSKITNVGVDRSLRGLERPSDHTPYWCELNTKPAS